jgi:hypothetical protein
VEFGGQTVAAIANGGQPPAANCYDDQGIELILFFETRYSFEKKILKLAHFLNLLVGVGAGLQTADGEMAHLDLSP